MAKNVLGLEIPTPKQPVAAKPAAPVVHPVRPPVHPPVHPPVKFAPKVAVQPPVPVVAKPVEKPAVVEAPKQPENWFLRYPAEMKKARESKIAK